MTKPAFFSKQVSSAEYYYLDLTNHADKPVSIVCGGRERCLPDYIMRRKTFPYSAVEFVAEGRGTLRMSGRTFKLSPGMLFSYKPGIPHEIRNKPSDPMLKYFIDFTGPSAEDLMQDTALASAPVQVSQPNQIRALFDAIQSAADEPDPNSSQICVLQFQILLLKTESLAAKAPFTHSRAMQSYTRCRQIIEKSYLSFESLKDIARACRMDEATICRLFKRFHSKTPYNYLIELKMRKAAERLQNSELLIKEVSDEMGFADPFHFSRSFKRVHGVSPQRFLELTSRLP